MTCTHIYAAEFDDDRNQVISVSSPSKLEGVGGSVSHHSASDANKRIKNTASAKVFRRELRNHSTPAEKSLWNWLKNDQIAGYRFRRQYSIGNYIVDFYCPKLKLAIELDGDYHYHGGMVKSDAVRDKWLSDTYQICTLRFSNEVAIKQPYVIINSINNYIKQLNQIVPHFPNGG